MLLKITSIALLLFVASECLAIQPGAYSSKIEGETYESMAIDAISKIKTLDAKKTIRFGINLHLLKNVEKCVVNTFRRPNAPFLVPWYKGAHYGFRAILIDGKTYFGAIVIDKPELQARIVLLIKEEFFNKAFNEEYRFNVPMGLCKDEKGEP